MQKQFSLYVPARYNSSKSTQSSKDNKTAGAKAGAVSWSAVYHAVESVGSSMHRKVVDGIFSPLLVYSTQMMPRLSARDHKVLNDKHTDQETLSKRSDSSSDQKKFSLDSAESENENFKLPQASPSIRERAQNDTVDFDNANSGEKSTSYWIQMPALKQYMSAAAISEMSASASRVLRRKKKFEDAPLSGNQHLGEMSKDLGNIGREGQNEISRMSASQAAAEDISNQTASERLEQGHQGESKSTSFISGNIPFATDILKKASSSSSDASVFKKLGVLPSSSSSSSAAANLPSSDPEHKQDSDPSETIKDDFDRSPTRIEYASSSHSGDVHESRGSEVIKQEEHTPSPGTTSYIYNNYNLKYIQVNLSNPITMFQTKKKLKPVIESQTVPNDSTTYFDSDEPLLEMTEALNSKDTCVSSVGAANSQTVVADKSKKYAEMAGKIKGEKAKQKAAEERAAKTVSRQVSNNNNMNVKLEYSHHCLMGILINGNSVFMGTHLTGQICVLIWSGQHIDKGDKSILKVYLYF